MGEKIAAIVLAAGEGKRMGSGIPKQYMLIKSRPLVYYALKAFEESAVDEVILVTGEDEIDYCKEYIVDRYHFNKLKKIVPGGWERYASVYFGLEAIEDADYVLIHDGARPMISAELIQKCIYYVKNIVHVSWECHRKIRLKLLMRRITQSVHLREKHCGRFRHHNVLNLTL